MEEVVLDLDFEERTGFRQVGVEAVHYQGHFQQKVDVEGKGGMKA